MQKIYLTFTHISSDVTQHAIIDFLLPPKEFHNVMFTREKTLCKIGITSTRYSITMALLLNGQSYELTQQEKQFMFNYLKITKDTYK